MSWNHFRRCLAALMLWLVVAGVQAAETRPLTFGLFPNLSPRTLATLYQPMRDFLEHELGRPVELATAVNFNAFTQRLLAREYDLVVAAPHLARLGQSEAGYRLLAHYEQPLQAYWVVPVKSNLQRLPDLAGKRVAVPDRMALVTMLGLSLLSRAGLEADRDYRLIEARSHNNAAVTVLNGEADVAVIGSVPLSQLAGEMRAQLRIIGQSQAIPSQYFAVSDRLSEPDCARIEQALFKFAASPAGQKFLHQFAMHGLVKAKPNELKGMDAYAKQVRQMLSQSVVP